MRYLPRAILAGGLGFAVSLLIAACGGGSGLLSSDQSSTLSSELASVSSALTAGNCGGVSDATKELSNQAGSLPATVNCNSAQQPDPGGGRGRLAGASRSATRRRAPPR